MRNKILLLITAALAGCSTPREDTWGYIIHDIVNDDYYAGKVWVPEENAWVMTKLDADGELERLIKNESGGYAHPAEAIKIERVPYRSSEHLESIVDKIEELKK